MCEDYGIIKRGRNIHRENVKQIVSMSLLFFLSLSSLEFALNMLGFYYYYYYYCY